ncbi:MAG TPA: lipase family protein [Blastocatellia bacterium]|nr:lipase family protein [Blastocatellia bacterium]
MEDQPKPIPRATLDNVLPPNRDRIFFENSQNHPFRYNSSRFELVNAWWLAEASLLVYDEEAYIREEFRKAGLVDFMAFTGSSTQCFVASNNDFIVVAFRGTQVYKRGFKSVFHEIVADILADISIILVDSQQGGYVHKGFKKALDEIWKDQGEKQGLESYLNQIKNAAGHNRTLWITGHSLGAALATLAADRYGNVQGVYTFGSPRVGDGAFKDDYHINTYRFVNNNDIVTNVPLIGSYEPLRLPPLGIYRHVDGLKYIDSKGQINDNQKLSGRLRDRFTGYFSHQFNVLGHLRSGFLGDIPDDGFVDHAPLFYANHIWNNYLEEMRRFTR